MPHTGKSNPSPARADQVCLLRLSALGDVIHTLAVVRALQAASPNTRISWLIGRTEARLLAAVDGIDWIVYDKHDGLRGIQRLRQQLTDRRFDTLLMMQTSLRANLLTCAIHADRRIGFNRTRAREGQTWFSNARIDTNGRHVLDVLMRFLMPLGIEPPTTPRWDLPITAEARAWASGLWPDGAPMLLLSPCSSHPLRNWRPERYAAVAEHARARGMQVALIGGRSALERDYADAITAAMREPPLDLVGKDSLERLPAILERADLLLSPDSGPVHIANAVGTPVLGLYACTDAERSGPYSDRRWCVNRYREAAERFMHCNAARLRWGQRIEKPGVMDLIETPMVIARLDAFLANTQ